MYHMPASTNFNVNKANMGLEIEPTLKMVLSNDDMSLALGFRSLMLLTYSKISSLISAGLNGSNYQRMILNVMGCKKAIPLIRTRGGGAIVNLASINAIRGNNRLVAYAATKGGVLAMTMSLALDHIGEHIRVNCVCPATIDTDMARGMMRETGNAEAAMQSIIAKHPIGRMAQPEEVASTIAFLASSDASFMTGLAIPVDGGRSIR